MPVLLRIALRNLREHRSKTLIVGIIIALGITILVIGNSTMDSVTRGIREAFIENQTGDVMISGKSDVPVSIFGLTVNTGTEEISTIPQYSRIYDYVSGRPEVAALAAQVGGMAMMNSSLDESNMAMLFGVEPESYFSTFKNSLTILQGTNLKPGERGIILSQEKIDEIKKNTGATIAVGDTITLTGIGAAGLKIREVPLMGIYRFAYTNDYMRMLAFVDVQTVRALNSMVLATAADLTVGGEATALLESTTPDDLFSADMVESAVTRKTPSSEKALTSLLGAGGEKQDRPQLDSGAWNFLLIKLKNSDQAPAFIAGLNLYFQENKIEARASDWLAASGPAGGFAYGLKYVFNVLVFIIAVVAIIIIMNTLVVSVIERTAEIGTMRALGAQKSFIRRLFILETMSISVIFGFIGIAFAVLILGVLGLSGLRAPNSFFELIFGGNVFHPSISAASMATAVGIVILIGIVSSLYPVLIALKIQPVKAIQTE
jgi:putative ABC transport system permease protein